MLAIVKLVPITFIVSTCTAGLATRYLFSKNFLLNSLAMSGARCFLQKKCDRGNDVPEKFCQVQSS